MSWLAAATGTDESSTFPVDGLLFRVHRLGGMMTLNRIKISRNTIRFKAAAFDVRHELFWKSQVTYGLLIGLSTWLNNMLATETNLE